MLLTPLLKSLLLGGIKFVDFLLVSLCEARRPWLGRLITFALFVRLFLLLVWLCELQSQHDVLESSIDRACHRGEGFVQMLHKEVHVVQLMVSCLIFFFCDLILFPAADFRPALENIDH